MAKIKETEETVIAPEQTGMQDTAIEQTTSAENPVEKTADKPASAENKSKKKETQPVETKTETAEIPEYVDGILKRFPGLEELYVDSHGGTFVPKTPERIRKGAVLYKNPYYKPA